jgi:hypothetical protein
MVHHDIAIRLTERLPGHGLRARAHSEWLGFGLQSRAPRAHQDRPDVSSETDKKAITWVEPPTGTRMRPTRGSLAMRRSASAPARLCSSAARSWVRCGHRFTSQFKTMRQSHPFSTSIVLAFYSKARRADTVVGPGKGMSGLVPSRVWPMVHISVLMKQSFSFVALQAPSDLPLRPATAQRS